MCHLVETSSLCFYQHRINSWTQLHAGKCVSRHVKRFHNTLMSVLRFYLVGLYLYSLSAQLTYFVLQRCVRSFLWYLRMSTIPTVVVHAFATAHLSWMLALKLRVIESDYALNAIRLFIAATAMVVLVTLLVVFQISKGAFPEQFNSSAFDLLPDALYYVFRATVSILAVYFGYVM